MRVARDFRIASRAHDTRGSDSGVVIGSILWERRQPRRRIPGAGPSRL